MGFFYSGGGERVVIEQTRRLRKRGHDVRVLSPIIYKEKSFPKLLKELGAERMVPHFPFPFPFRESSAMIAAAVLPFGIRKAADCDVLLCHSQPSMWLGYRLNALYGLPYVGYLHQLTTFIHPRPTVAGNWNPRDFLILDTLLGRVGKPIARHLDRLCHLKAAKLLFNSNWTRKLFEDAYGVTGTVCYPAIDSHARAVASVRKNNVVLAARHYPWKRIDLAFMILKRLKSQIPHLLITNRETSHTPSLKKTATALQIDSHVIFTGYVDDDRLAEIYREAKGYIQTSIHEPFGLGPLEAQGYGVPAVVWGDAGAKETVVDGETGFHAIPYDLDDFASKLDFILADQALWSQMSRDAEKWASSFTWDSHIDTVEAALHEAKK